MNLSNRRTVSIPACLLVLLCGFFPFTAAAAIKSGSTEISLNGDWQFQPGDLASQAAYETGFNDRQWPKIKVPSNWYLQGYDISGVAWYRRHFRVDRSLAGKTLTLNFSGVDYAAEVWLNGEYLGFHEGYFQPFVFDVSKFIKPGKDNVLVLRVDSPVEKVGPEAWSLNKRLIKGIFSHHDTRPGGAWSARGQEKNTGGIWSDVKLLISNQVVLENIKVSPHIDTLGKSASADLAIKLDNTSRNTLIAEMQIRLEPANFTGKSLEITQPIYLAAGQSEQRISIAAPEYQLWWPVGFGQPNLYRLKMRLLQNGQVLTAKELDFGFRSIVLDPDSQMWLVNGKRIFLRGTNYIPTQWLSEMDNAKYQHDVDMMTDANINVVRVHAHVGAEEFYRVCDRSGLLVWQDFPLQWGYVDTPEFMQTARQQSLEMVNFLYNHPAIITWSIHNEPPWDATWMKYKYPNYNPNQNRQLDDVIYQALLAADSTRHVHKTSATAEHQWLGWYSGSWLDFTGLTKQRIITEYGAQALPNLDSLKKIFPESELWPETQAAWDDWDYHNFQKKETFEIAKVPHGNTIQEFIANSQHYQAKLIQLAAESLRRQKYQPVTSIFQFMFVEDWPSLNWGIVDYWRQPKPGYAALKAAYQPVLPSIEWKKESYQSNENIQLGLWIVNDNWQKYPQAKLSYQLTGPQTEFQTEDVRVVNIDEDSAVKVMDTPSYHLDPGQYTLHTKLVDQDGRGLGSNSFDFTVTESAATEE